MSTAPDQAAQGGVRPEVRGAVATLTIDRPNAKNALRPEDWAALRAGALAAEADPSVRVIVITGTGGAFCAGGDLKSMPERLALPHPARRAQLLDDAQVVLTLRRLTKPVVAVIEGPAVGAGLSLALACDVRLAATTAKLGATFHKVGLTGDFGLLWLLPRTVGPGRALDLLYSAELLTGAEAERVGLVSRAFPPERLADEARAYVARLAEGPPLALAATKAGIHRALEVDLADAIAWEADAQATCSRSADAREGVAAFAERRAPRFTGS